MSILQTFNNALIKHINPQNNKDFCVGDCVLFANTNIGIVISSYDHLVSILFSTKVHYYDDLTQQIQQEIDSYILKTL